MSAPTYPADPQQYERCLQLILDFLKEIGIGTRFVPGPLENTFVPGIRIENGSLSICRAQLLYPGDLLHEAAHLAVVPPETRAKMNDSAGDSGGDEMAAIAWSYAALRHLRLSPDIVFHPEGYKGGSKSIIENFTAGRYFGVPLLQLYGLSREKKQAEEKGEEAFPVMKKWTRD